MSLTPESKLAAFGAKVLESSRSLDGDIQQWALDTGCLVSKIVHAPCSEDNCVCAEVSGFPTECYFVADDVFAALEAISPVPSSESPAFDSLAPLEERE